MLVHMYSTSYMGSDPHLPRFMSYLSLFTLFMLILVTGDNYLQLFIGWEGVGLCSYLLINFWFTRIQANKSAIKAMIVNRIGDLGLALAMFTMAYSYGSLDFTTLFSLTETFSNNYIYKDIHTVTVIGVLLFIGAVGKSAQLGLHTWLPDAMEGWQILKN
jgi:NADH:ubiquinone oxidoreductase subunit 5 (subunit L)/multisubunit Na+/H+ antiporter MnhA subunit